MSAEIIKKLLRAHAINDEHGFRKAAMQLAAKESRAGHTKVAEDIRKIIAEIADKEPVRLNLPADISAPRGKLADLLEGGYRKEKLRDIVLCENTERDLKRILEENRNASSLIDWGVEPSRKLIFHGPPGCGKTLAASVVAGEMGLPLLTVRFESLFSRFLGETASHLRAIFQEIAKRPAVYLFDEFDSIGKKRSETNDVGEMRRVVNSFLQLLDLDKSRSVIIAATNFEEIIDHALSRRFDLTIRFPQPTKAQIKTMIKLRLSMFDISERTLNKLADIASGASYADTARCCDEAIKTMVLDHRKTLKPNDLLESFNLLISQAKQLGRIN